ncbi:Protein FAR-RED ELONGATED HYPOCOTYL 3, partial [Bienertia sinuspersici]
VLMYILYADMWPDNISAGKKGVCMERSVDGRNVDNNTNEELCQDESDVDGGISLSNDNDVIPSNNDVNDTVTDVIGKGRATPEVGMTFDSFEAVDEFYSAFGKAMGFGYWHCECGPPNTKKKNNVEGERIGSPGGTSRRRKKSKKCGCGAGMAAFLNKDGLWQIHKVELTHTNHAPSPSKSRYVPNFRDVPKFVIRIVKDLIDAGVKQSQIYHALANQLNGFENIPFLLKDMHNALQKDRCKEFDDQDCHSMHIECPQHNEWKAVHHFFKGFMNAKTTLRNFVQKYTRALDHRANAEKVATANDDRRKARVKSTSIVEKHFQKVYTDAKFREVQHECFSLMYCLPKGETLLTEH